VVAGWTIYYVLKGVTGQFAQLQDPDAAWKSFVAFIVNPVWPIVYHAIFIGLCIAIVHSGVRKGIERWCKYLMPALFLVMAAIIIRSLTLPGSGEGLTFLFRPDFSKLTTNAFIMALGQAFFSLSLGMGAMLTYGSYLNKKENLWKSALTVAGLDTGIALLAGIAIFPVVFAMGFDPAAGPELVFKVLPAVFSRMPGGIFIWGTLFFLLLAIAALTSGVSLLEVIIAYYVDENGSTRRKVSVWGGLVIFLIGVPCALSFGLLAEFTFFGRTIFDNLDYLATNILLPLGGLLCCLFVGWFWGMGPAIAELGDGSPEFHKKYYKIALTILVRYVAPVAIFLVFLDKILN